MATYNGAQYLSKTIESILYQEGRGELFEIELIVVDDCSQDGTIEILESYGLTYTVNAVNSGGPNKGRNIGLSMAKGSWINIADQDDVWYPHRIKTILEYASEYPIVSSGYHVLDQVTMKKETITGGGDLSTGVSHYNNNKTFLHKLSKSKNKQTTFLGALFFRRDILSYRFEEEVGSIDFDFVLKLLEGHESLEILETLYLRHITGENLSLNEQYRLHDFNKSLSVIQSYEESYPDAVNAGKKRLHGSLGRYYYLIGNMPEARRQFAQSELDFKIVLYYLTSYVGSEYVKKRFRVFG